MTKPNYYWTVTLIDGTVIDFNKLCTLIENWDDYSYAFKSKNHSTKNELTLMIIPKNQILKIVNEYNPDDLEKVWEDTN